MDTYTQWIHTHNGWISQYMDITSVASVNLWQSLTSANCICLHELSHLPYIYTPAPSTVDVHGTYDFPLTQCLFNWTSFSRSNWITQKRIFGNNWRRWFHGLRRSKHWRNSQGSSRLAKSFVGKPGLASSPWFPFSTCTGREPFDIKINQCLFSAKVRFCYKETMRGLANPGSAGKWLLKRGW